MCYTLAVAFATSTKLAIFSHALFLNMYDRFIICNHLVGKNSYHLRFIYFSCCPLKGLQMVLAVKCIQKKYKLKYKVNTMQYLYGLRHVMVNLYRSGVPKVLRPKTR